MKIIIAGGRDFNNYVTLMREVGYYLLECSDVEIISGGAKGADKLGEIYAKWKNIPVKIFPANWNKHGKAAGPIRNAQMAEYADMLIAFWDGKSRGTANMIEEAKKRNLIIHIINY